MLVTMLATIFVLIEILSRLTPHIPNFTPVTAAAIFAGVYLNKRFALLIPLLILVTSDYLLLYINPYNSPMVNFSKAYPLSSMFHSTTLFVWGSFMVSGLIGIWLKSKKRPLYILGGTVFASLQFFAVTNFGVWATTNMYPHNLSGLMESYIMGIPFYRNTLLGDLFYITTFFTLYEISFKISKQFFPRGILHVQNVRKQL